MSDVSLSVSNPLWNVLCKHTLSNRKARKQIFNRKFFRTFQLRGTLLNGLRGRRLTFVNYKLVKILCPLITFIN